MIDRTERLYSVKSGSTIELPPWVPPKKQLKTAGHYIISKSYPEVEGRTIQYALRHFGTNLDMMRAESSASAFFSAYWYSQVSANDFLIATEKLYGYFGDYFREFPTLRVGLFIPGVLMEQYEAQRPIVVDDFKESAAFAGSEMRRNTLLRIDSEGIDVCYDLSDETVGIISNNEDTDPNRTRYALSEYVNQTQPALLPSVVDRFLKVVQNDEYQLRK